MKKKKRKPTEKPSEARKAKRATTRTSKGNVSARFGELFYQIPKSTGQRGCEIWRTLLPNTLKTRDKGHHGGQSYGNVCARFGELFYQILTKHGRKVEKQTEVKVSMA